MFELLTGTIKNNVTMESNSSETFVVYDTVENIMRMALLFFFFINIILK